MARVLVVEDESDIARLVQRALLLEGLKVDVVGDGQAALAAIRDDPPDLIVLDRMLPGIDGMEVCRRVRAADDALGRAPIPILMLTALAYVSDRVAGLEAGADDYLPKPFAVAELVARVRALLRRATTGSAAASSPAVAAEVFRVADLVLDLGSRTVARGERPVRLTAREFDLLALFLRHPNQVFPHRALMERVWGEDFYGESNVLAVTVAALRRALEEEGEPRLIQTVRGVGYALREQP
jgi:two-component system response regulator MprA